MRIDVHPADLGGCGHYRLIWPATAVQKQFSDVEVRISDVSRSPQAPEHDVEQDDMVPMQLKDEDGRTSVVGVDPRHTWPDVLVLQRPLQRLLAESIPFIQAHGTKVIVEVDDDFSAIHPQNHAWRHAHPDLSPERNGEHLARACVNADLVTVSTPALAARYGAHGRVKILQNYVPQAYLTIRKPEPDPDYVFIGWSGSLASHPTDLPQLSGAIPSVMREYPRAAMRIVGAGGPTVASQLGIRNEVLGASGWVPLRSYPRTLAKLDVGVVPLDLIPFNEAKSWLKGLEMASLGVPFIASSTQQYRALSEDHGIGTIAYDRRVWKRLISKLVADDVAREEAGEEGRLAVRARKLTIEDHAIDWKNAWTSVLA